MKNMSARARKSLKCVAIILSVILCGGGCFLALFLSSRAIYTTDTTSYVKVDEIYDDTTGAFDANNVNALLKYITGNSSITYENASSTLNTLATNKTTSADIRSKSVTVNGVTKSSSQDVIVRFGGLDWQVVYLSKTTEEAGEDIILTLWLSSSQQDAWADRPADEGLYYGFIDGSLYSDWSADWASASTSIENPANMYGSSYIRCVSLNAGGTYSTSNLSTTSATQNESSVFARFTMEDVEGSLTQYITTPSKVSWQLDQSAVTELNWPYNYPNDSIGEPSDGSYDSGLNYHGKSNYGQWATDYIWLPSMTETGYDSSHIGIWDTSTEQRQNLSSSILVSGIVGSYNQRDPSLLNISWLRSGDCYYSYSAFNLLPTGGDYYSNTYNRVNASYAVRPALHLNLNAVLDDIVANLPYAKVDELYDDEAGKMSEENVNVLLKYITGQADVSVDNASEVLGSLASATRSSEDFRANVVSTTGASKQAGQEIKITFGGLDWWATYLSTDTDGNVILTLWLDESQQDAWADRPADEGELYGFINGSLYSDWAADWYDSYSYNYSYPSNMYGTSYIRAVTLNSGGQYALDRDELSQIDENDPYNGQSPNSVFARFTMEEVEGSLTQYITTPNKVSWQLDQSAVREGTNSYNQPNDSIESPTSGSYYSGFDYHGKTNYDAWQNDYLWLPSNPEVGYSSSKNGMWETSTEQRQNLSSSINSVGSVGSSAGSAYNDSWLRSGNSYYAYDAYTLSPSGGGYGSRYVDDSYAVRPALHLNLSKVIKDVLGVVKLTLDDNGGSGGDGEIFATEDGYYANEQLATKIEGVTVPSFTAHKFLGYFTEGGMQVTDANGVITMTSSQFTEATTLFAHWEARNPAYYDSEGGFWYVENGKLPQSKVSDSLKSTLSGRWSSLTDGSVYYMGVEELAENDLTDDGGMQSKVYNGEEYVKFNGEYYLVEPIRWRLVYSSSQQEGYAVENTSVLATMAEIVFLGSYSSTKIGVGDGYSAESVTMLLKNQVSTEFLVSESREVEIFGAPKNTTSVSGSVFVASSEELANFTTSKNNTTGSGVKAGKVSLSDFVKDYLRATGQGDYYFTRDLGDQLNTIRCLNPVGDRSQAKAQQTLGVQFTVKVTEYACISA